MNPIEDQQYLYESYNLSKDFDVKIHKNGIVLIFLTQTCEWKSIQYDQRVKEQLEQLSGKRKHGATTQLAHMIFGKVNDGKNEFEIPSPFRAKLIEVNEELEKKMEPQQLLCIYHPKWDQVQTLKTCLSKKQNGIELIVDEQKFMEEFVQVQMKL